MGEKVLHYIWAYQLFSQRPLYTTRGEKIEVLRAGCINENAGPDFLHAHIQLDGEDRYGTIEIDTKGRMWVRHGHAQNPDYNEVILHVVWDEATTILSKKGANIPVLSLARYVDATLLARYTTFMDGADWVPCEGHLQTLVAQDWDKMIERAVEQRLKRKSEDIRCLFTKNGEDSEATCYQLLAHSLGAKMNSRALLRLSQVVPGSVVAANRVNRFYLEAILLGQAGFLTGDGLEAMEDYERDILELYAKLQRRHKLNKLVWEPSWKFFRLRPAHFPTIRIAQLCALLHAHESIFYLLINQKVEDMYEALCIKQSIYWRKHYLFGKKSGSLIGGLGREGVKGILINGVVPLLATYGGLRKDDFYVKKAMNMLKELPAEENTIIKKWRGMGMRIDSAFESQGALELFSQFCSPKKCLACHIGQTILQRPARVALDLG